MSSKMVTSTQKDKKHSILWGLKNTFHQERGDCVNKNDCRFTIRDKSLYLHTHSNGSEL
jgi:hypothetical protein